MGRSRSAGGGGRLRIIGGRWRGRRISVPDRPGVRPTGDRVRETVFNWLAPVIDGARCLDLFAGTGALGLEAMSRGAGYAMFVEHDAPAAEQLERNIAELECGQADVVTGDALRFLNSVPEPFDIVFLDPPFGEMDLGNLCTLLGRGWLADGAYVYIETSRHAGLSELPSDWVVERDKTAGQVIFALARKP